MTLAGAKQVWRRRGEEARFARDCVAAREEPSPGSEWEPLLEPVMRGGCAMHAPSLAELRESHRAEMRAMPPAVVGPEAQGEYPVTLSPTLAGRQREAMEYVRAREAMAR